MGAIVLTEEGKLYEVRPDMFGAKGLRAGGLGLKS